MKALIHNNRVVDLSETPFEVHSDLFWVDANDDVRVGWEYDNGSIKEPELPEYDYRDLRIQAYPRIKEFVDAFYWSQRGDNTKMEEYLSKCDDVKTTFPKPESN